MAWMKEARPIPHSCHLPTAAAAALHWSGSQTRHLERPRLVPATSHRKTATRSRRGSPNTCAIAHTSLRPRARRPVGHLPCLPPPCVPFSHTEPVSSRPGVGPALPAPFYDTRLGIDWEQPESSPGTPMRSPYLRTERCRATVARGAGGHRVAAVGLRCERGAGRGRRGLTSACSTQAS